MTVVDEFRAWLRQWFSEEEVEAMVDGRWPVDDGVRLRGNLVMNVEEFLTLAATFAAGKALGNRPLKTVVKYVEVYALDMDTRTVVIASAYRLPMVAATYLEGFLKDMVKQAEEARDGYMSVRAIVS